MTSEHKGEHIANLCQGHLLVPVTGTKQPRVLLTNSWSFRRILPSAFSEA